MFFSAMLYLYQYWKKLFFLFPFNEILNGVVLDNLPDFTQTIPAGAAGQMYMQWLAINCNTLTARKESKVSQFGISFPFNTRLLHIFLTMPNRKILSAYPYMQLHHIPLNTPNPVISMKISFLLSKYRCPSVRFACGQYQTAAQAIKQWCLTLLVHLAPQLSYLVSLQLPQWL